VVVIEGIAIPLFLRGYRRELDERVHGGALGPIVDDDRR
jgi:hypothetical protein